MNPCLRSLFLSTALLISGLCLPAAGEGSREKSERSAMEALTRLGVPLQRDVHGSARWIEARSGEMSDKALRLLPALHNLEWLEIGGGAVTASGLESLKDCRSLKRLYLHDLDLGGRDLPWLSALTGLEALSLQHTGIDGRALRNIRSRDRLKVLNLTGNPISDEDMDGIAEFRGLEVLALADTPISGIGLAKLKNLKLLNALNLARTRVRNEDIQSLVHLPNLRIAYVWGCGVSEAAVIQVRSRAMLLAVFR